MVRLSVCWAIWTIGNKVTFADHVVQTLVKVFFTLNLVLILDVLDNVANGDDKTILGEWTKKLLKNVVYHCGALPGTC